ncbi:MAG: hypothetical protein IKQ71_00465 [Lachnospiraceae bacterium]|nr:hypothetical protein [Lachnospiraceae bacterium]
MKRFATACVVSLFGLMLMSPSVDAMVNKSLGASVPINLFTGEPEESTESENGSAAVMPDGSYYDNATGMFTYKVSDGSISVSVYDGMIVTNEVAVSVSEGTTAKMFMNGDELESIPSKISSPGTYVIMGNGTNGEEQVMSFQMVAKLTGDISQYMLPEGFSVKSVYLDDKQAATDYGLVEMEEEGTYSITYTCSANSKEYYLNVTIDHTPPAVTFDGLDEKNRARGPVTVNGLTKTDKVYVTYEGEEGRLNMHNQVTESGDYRIVVSDDAGNIVDKEFTILVYFNNQAWLFLLLIVLVIGGIFAALYISRKRLRVR